MEKEETKKRAEAKESDETIATYSRLAQEAAVGSPSSEADANPSSLLEARQAAADRLEAERLEKKRKAAELAAKKKKKKKKRPARTSGFRSAGHRNMQKLIEKCKLDDRLWFDPDGNFFEPYLAMDALVDECYAFMNKHDINKAEFARLCRLSVRTIRNILSDSSTNVSTTTAMYITQVLRMAIDDFVRYKRISPQRPDGDNAQDKTIYTRAEKDAIVKSEKMLETSLSGRKK